MDERVVQQATQRGEHMVTAYAHRYSWPDVGVQPTVRPPEKPCVRRAAVGHQRGQIYGLRRRGVTAGTSQERCDDPVEPLHLPEGLLRLLLHRVPTGDGHFID